MQGDGGLPPRTVQSGTGQEPRKRQRSTLARGALQGRFSGRLARKEDEAQLVVECALLGPLLGDTQPATLSTIVRSIASGRVRKYLEQHLPHGGAGGGDVAADLQAAWQSRAAIAAAEAQSQQLAQAQAELNALKARLWDSAARNAELEKQGAIQQRMLQMLTGGQSTPPASLAEAAAADVAAAAAQQQSQPQQQLQPTLPAVTQQLGGSGGGGFAHAPSSGFAELMAPSHWGAASGGAFGGGTPSSMAAAAAAAAVSRPTLSPVGALTATGGLLAPVTAAALTSINPLQNLRFGSGGELLSGSGGGGGGGLPAYSAAPPASQGGGFVRPKSGDGWAPMRPSNGTSAFTAPAAGSAFSPPTAARPAAAAAAGGMPQGANDAKPLGDEPAAAAAQAEPQATAGEAAPQDIAAADASGDVAAAAAHAAPQQQTEGEAGELAEGGAIEQA